MVKELKEKDEAGKSSEGPGHVFHNASREMVTGQGPYNIYSTPSAHAPQHSSYSHRYGQHPYVWQHQAYPTYQHFAQPPGHSVAANSSARQEQQHSSQPQPANLEVAKSIRS
jgi:hypothetical protein